MNDRLICQTSNCNTNPLFSSFRIKRPHQENKKLEYAEKSDSWLTFWVLVEIEKLAFGKLNVVTRNKLLYIFSRASYCSEAIDDNAA